MINNKVSITEYLYIAILSNGNDMFRIYNYTIYSEVFKFCRRYMND